MKTALIAMTILGCDDSVNQCQYIATAQEHWVSVELCDAASERVLERYGNVSYPMVIAVCQPPEAESTPAVAEQQPLPLPMPVPAPPESEHKGLASRALDRIREALPGTAGIRMVFEKPLHVVSDSYAWVAKKITN
ncbi:hypothetical protein [Rhizobium sp. RU36D]|uniref:hypothetical protein n=1 Tax=Rhizobium sp. RU36D TaxID=1907415 RepID=UPI0009D8C0F3|nr:hypothetical protein [Rhizobium sp. RU36D]SMC67472.1 hypothetical protein SAMN05880593_104176 [Rhizobium sp. RU36D]